MSNAYEARSQEVVGWLKAIGVDVPLARRIVIDIEVGNVAKVYVEAFSDSKMLELRFPYEAREIEIVTNELAESTT